MGDSGPEARAEASRWTWGIGAALVALAAAGALAVVRPWMAVLPLGLFLVACAAAPFFPAWGFFGKTVVRGRAEPPGVALTFDDGPHPSTTGPLLDLLRERRVRAAFFVVGRHAAAHPDLVRRMAAEGHEVGNHSASHDVWLMLRGSRTVLREIRNGNEALAAVGVRTLAFRPPVGIVGPRLFPALRRQGMFAVGFSRRARDFGNRRVSGLAQRLLPEVRPGDIVLLHDGAVAAEGGAEQWLDEVRRVLDGLVAMGLAVRPLSEHIDRPILG